MRSKNEERRPGGCCERKAAQERLEDKEEEEEEEEGERKPKDTSVDNGGQANFFGLMEREGARGK